MRLITKPLFVFIAGGTLWAVGVFVTAAEPGVVLLIAVLGWVTGEFR